MTALLMSLLCSFQLAASGAREPVQGKKADVVRDLKDQIQVVEGEIARLRQQVSRASNAPEAAGLQLSLAAKLGERARLLRSLRAEQEPASEAYDAPEVIQAWEAALEVLKGLTHSVAPSDRGKGMLETARILREFGRYDSMIQTVARLTDAFPGSAEAGWALLLLGDHHFDRGQLAAAGQVYRRLLAGAFPADAQDLARFKLGWILINETRNAGRDAWEEPLHLFEQVVRSGRGRTSSGVDRPFNLRREALSAIVFCVTEALPEEKLLPFFDSLQLSREEALLVFGKLAHRTFVKERYLLARTLYQKLLALSPDPYDAEDYRHRCREIERLLRRQK